MRLLWELKVNFLSLSPRLFLATGCHHRVIKNCGGWGTSDGEKEKKKQSQAKAEFTEKSRADKDARNWQMHMSTLLHMSYSTYPVSQIPETSLGLWCSGQWRWLHYGQPDSDRAAWPPDCEAGVSFSACPNHLDLDPPLDGHRSGEEEIVFKAA